jgi:hypothetical protein
MIPLEITTGVERRLHFKRWHFEEFSIVCYDIAPIQGECINKAAEEWADTIDPNNIPKYGYQTTCKRNT